MFRLSRSISFANGVVSSFTRQQESLLSTRIARDRLVDLVDIATLPNRLPLAKIIATIGPASEQLPMLTQVTAAGLNIMRINFSHATYEEADLRVTNLHLCSPSPNIRAVMLDTQGPEIRTGSFGNGVKEVELKKGQSIVLTSDPAIKQNQSADKIWISYGKLASTVKPGDSILLDDGAIEVKVDKIDGSDIQGVVNNNGSLGNKKSANLPGLKVDLPAISEKDKMDIRWGIKHDIDFIAASFVRKAKDITDIREYVTLLMKELVPPGTPSPQIIAKIESIEALENFEEILQTTDAVMLARGDLGVEIPMETLANVQKEVITRCNLAGVPVVVATQMLESMQNNPRPTRAECTDVANAIFDGADCVMLSGESAKGKYPIRSVETIRKIVVEAERFLLAENESSNQSSGRSVLGGMVYAGPNQGTGSGVVEKSRSVNAKCIVVTQGTQTDSRDLLVNVSINISRFRPNIPIVTFVNTPKQAKLLQIHRGIYPIVVTSGTSHATGSTADVTATLDKVVDLGFASRGDSVVIVSSDSLGSNYSRTITTRSVRIE